MKTLVTGILERLDGITKSQEKFFLTLFVAILATHSKITFLNLARHSSLHEKTYRRGFRKSFDFASFNQQAIEQSIDKKSKKLLHKTLRFTKKVVSRLLDSTNFGTVRRRGLRKA